MLFSNQYILTGPFQDLLPEGWNITSIILLFVVYV